MPGLIHLPTRVLAGFSIAIIGLHNLLDKVSAERFGGNAWLCHILHQQNVFAFLGINFVTAYPVLPSIGVMAAGYCLGTVYLWDASRRERFLIPLGLALTLFSWGCVRSISTAIQHLGVTDPQPYSPCSLSSTRPSTRLHSTFS